MSTSLRISKAGEVTEGHVNTSNSIVPGSSGISVKVKEGSMSLNMGSGEDAVTHLPVKESVTTLDREAASPDSILATARNRMGRPVSAFEVKPGDRVRYQGMEMTVQQAVDAGLVTTVDGRYVNLIR
jgi:hypothetical protein